MEIFEYDKRDNIIKEIRKEIKENVPEFYVVNEFVKNDLQNDEKLIDFALAFLLSNLEDLEEYFYGVE
jgi:hypothetical protein